MATPNPLPAALESAGVDADHLANFLGIDPGEVAGWLMEDDADAIPAGHRPRIAEFVGSPGLFDPVADPLPGHDHSPAPDSDPDSGDPDSGGPGGQRKAVSKRKLPAADRPVYAAVRLARMDPDERAAVAAVLRPNAVFSDSDSDVAAVAAAVADPKGPAWATLRQISEVVDLDGWKLGAFLAQMKAAEASALYRALQLLAGVSQPAKLPPSGTADARIQALAEAIGGLGKAAAERVAAIDALTS